MTKICTFDGMYARFAISTIDHVTTRFHPGSYVEEDLGAHGTRQLCYGLRGTGGTINWADSRDPEIVAKAFAEDIGAKLLSEAEYEAALAAARSEAA